MELVNDKMSADDIIHHSEEIARRIRIYLRKHVPAMNNDQRHCVAGEAERVIMHELSNTYLN